MNKIDINEEEGYILTVGVLLKSLKKFGWSAVEVEQLQQAIHLTVLEALAKTREVISEEIVAYTADHGFDETALFGLARAEYALRGIEIASELHRKRLAACN
jgi:hypothetical protein